MNQAPALPGWHVVALKQGQGFGFTMEYEGVRLEPDSMWFILLENPADPSALGVRVGIPDLADEDAAERSVRVMLFTALGERIASEQLQHVEVCALPGDAETRGFLELAELPLTLEARRRDQQR